MVIKAYLEVFMYGHTKKKDQFLYKCVLVMID